MGDESKVPKLDPKHIAPQVGEHIVFTKHVSIIRVRTRILNLTFYF